MTDERTDATADPDRPRKRVVLKVWRQDGVIYDNAHEITWLERNGWRVECAEKLLDDPHGGTSAVLYVLGPSGIPAPTPNPLAAADLQEDTFKQVTFPTEARQVVFVCRATRGRIIVRPLSPSGNEEVISAPLTVGHFPDAAAGMVLISLPSSIVVGNPNINFLRMAVLCVNDASPALDTPAPGLPDAPDAEMRVDAFYTVDSQEIANPDKVEKLINVRVHPGQVAAFYFELSRQHA